MSVLPTREEHQSWHIHFVNNRLSWVKCQPRVHFEVAMTDLQSLRVPGLEGTSKVSATGSHGSLTPPLGAVLQRPLKSWGGSSHLSFARRWEGIFCFNKSGISLAFLLYALLFS